MSKIQNDTILVFNAGSSSIKFALYLMDNLRLIYRGSVVDIFNEPLLHVYGEANNIIHSESSFAEDYQSAINAIAHYIKKHSVDYKIKRLTDIVSGFVVSSRQTVRACLEQLASAYFFDCVESDGILKFIKRGTISNTTIDFTELVSEEDHNETFNITRTQELELPRQVDVIYINRNTDYQTGTQSSQRQTVRAVDYLTINLPIVLADQEAKIIADVSLYNAWVGRSQYSFKLSPKYSLLEPTDVITVTKDGASYVIRINSTKLVRNGIQEVAGVAEDVSSYDFYNPAGNSPANLTPPVTISDTRLELMDLPAFPTDNQTDAFLKYCVVGLGANWGGW